MAFIKSLLNSNVLHIFRGYIRGILADNNEGFTPRSTNFCIYKQVADSLSNNIKDLVLHVLNEELEKSKEEKLIGTIDLKLIDLITDDYLYINAPILPLENIFNNEFEKIINNCKYKSNNFIIIELPKHFRLNVLSSRDLTNDQVEEDNLDSDDGLRNEVIHFGVFNTTTNDPSNEFEESIYRVLKRFIERTMMQENFNIHLIMVSPYFKPPQVLLGKGMFEIYLSIEWETNKSNLTQLIKDIFEGTEVANDVIEMIIASISYQNSAYSTLIDLCYELKHFLVVKYIGKRVIKGKDADLNGMMKIRNEDVQEFLQKYNSKKLSSYYSSSIDSLIATKISIDNDFVGLNELRKMIKKSISALEQFNNHSEFSGNELDMYGYPISWFLWGSSGSGKSTLVRSMTSISPKVKVLFCNIIDLISPLHGITTRNLRRIFKNAMNSRPCILVFDDIETLGTFSKKEDLNEGEVRSKINRELASTLLYLLDSVISINQDVELNKALPKLIDMNLQEGNAKETIDQLNSQVSRKVLGLMIIMTSRANMSHFMPELLLKIQRHSFLQLPSTKELLDSISKGDDSEISIAAQEVADEIQKLKGDRLINVSEFKILVQNKLYEKYANRESNSNICETNP
ncbi:AAA superfamily ATPase [Cryptosporidium ubiquitum]|uniref:AAA superfamily ATPase n=1 Tax=Cryptosporidium ubiquitum TaxID=857276 RepID=A0A1J4MPB5_9CRYT|nr:AAA superfamily ATPase [Cryptosporidium ubiquitum]OII74717.1 AAA superfamily ATPase [Cryptosporidium ubiquitum]